MNDRFTKLEAFRDDSLWEQMHNQTDRNYRRVLKKERAKAEKKKGARS